MILCVQYARNGGSGFGATIGGIGARNGGPTCIPMLTVFGLTTTFNELPWATRTIRFVVLMLFAGSSSGCNGNAFSADVGFRVDNCSNRPRSSISSNCSLKTKVSLSIVSICLCLSAGVTTGWFRSLTNFARLVVCFTLTCAVFLWPTRSRRGLIIIERSRCRAKLRFATNELAGNELND